MKNQIQRMISLNKVERIQGVPNSAPLGLQRARGKWQCYGNASTRKCLNTEMSQHGNVSTRKCLKKKRKPLKNRVFLKTFPQLLQDKRKSLKPQFEEFPKFFEGFPFFTRRKSLKPQFEEFPNILEGFPNIFDPFPHFLGPFPVFRKNLKFSVC